jgi:hypothetical protein
MINGATRPALARSDGGPMTTKAISDAPNATDE